MAASSAYSNSLFSKKRGFALYVPERSNSVQRTDTEHGLQIGDVGMITPIGSFDLFFNVYAHGEHPVNARGLPEGCPVTPRLKDEDIVDQTYPETTFTGVNNTVIDGATLNQDATLVLPNGYTAYDLRDTSTLKASLHAHAQSWYKFAIDVCRRSPDSPLYVVTGLDKTNSWKIASNSSEVTRTTETVGEGAEHKSGTSWSSYSSPSFRVPQTAADGPLDQCVFFRAFAVSVKVDEVDDEDEEDGIVVVGDSSPPPHPSEKINALLLQSTPKAKVAITHDEDWFALIAEDNGFPTDDELSRRLGDRRKEIIRSDSATVSL